MPKPSRRTQRLASRIKYILGQVIQRDLSDPRLGLVTVLEVEPTEDLKEAKIYVSVLGSASDRSKAEHALNSARGYLQKELGKNLETRNTPVLRFIFEQSSEKTSRIESLLDEVSQEDQEPS